MVDELTAPLCAALTGVSPSHEVLVQLEEDNLFIIAQDPQAQRYRYHHLFRDFLLGQAKLRIPNDLPKLHLRAAHWYAEMGDIEQAIRHGLQSDDLAWTANQIAVRADTMWTYREMWVLRRWIEALPLDIRMAFPKTFLYQAWTLLMTGDFPAVESALKKLDDILPQADGPVAELFGIAAVVKATYYVQTNRPGAIALYQEAIKLLPENAVNWLGGAYLGLGMAHFWGTGDLMAANEWLAKAVQTNLKIGNTFAALYANYIHGQTQIGLGRLKSARQIYRQALALIKHNDSIPNLMASWAYLGLGEILFEQDHPANAAHHFLKAVQLGKQRENKETIVRSLLGLTQIEAAMGNWASAEALLEEAEIYAHKPGIPDLHAEVHQAQIRLSLQQGNLHAARGALQRPAFSQPTPIMPWEISSLFLTARLLLAEEAYQEANELLIKLEKALPIQKRAVWLEITVSRALALAETNQTEAAIQNLKPALSFAATSGHKRLFLEAGSKMADLLKIMDNQDAAGRYARVLLEKFGGPTTRPTSSGPALIEPLSETENEILVFLAQGLTNEEIATNRVVSVNTVKWHLKNIFGKLGVRNRTAAVARARGLGLVE